MIVKGQKINDRYQIIRAIGEGGMANVYLAHDLILDRDVAVKVLRGDLANDEKFVRRFQREAIAASSLSHPNIVEMYDVGEDDGKYFIVMEYIEGQTLKNLIKKRGALTLSEVIDIMLQLTSGLICAHESYIIHRDIKPQNVLILDDGRVKITDFGIAVALNSNELTQTNSVMGSVHYLPPEQANGTGATIKSDIYSLGILMYELIVGKLPFKGENAVEIAIKQMKDPIPSVCEYNPDIPQSIENIILKATAKNPKNRYENVKEMHDDIETALLEERKNEPKLVYQYPESEYEEEKVNTTRSKKNADKVENEKEQAEDKKINNKLKIVGIISAILVTLLLLIFIVIPHFTKTKEIEIPDVTNMTEAKARKQLEKLGFEVANTSKEKDSDKIDEGKVISTSPKIGKTVKKGTKITLTISKGKGSIEVEDYTGYDYEKIKEAFEEIGVTVEIDYEEHSTDDNMKDGEIVSQSVEKGEELKKGDSIKLTVVKTINVYPDFVNENYTLEQVQAFCDKNGITLEATEKETSSATPGTIIYQSRTAGTKVASGVTLKVTVAKKVADVEVSSVTLNRGDQTLTVGDTVTVSATVNPTNATNKNVTWESSNTGVATVNNGIIKAVGKGTATITVTSSNGKTNSIKVTVSDKQVNIDE